MLHTTRDFKSFTGTVTNYYLPYMCAYYLAIFCKTTLGYTSVGQTNFNLDTTPLRLGTGSLGSLNQGPNDINAFSPNGYAVTAADINRILCLKSPANGMVNSGLFRVVAVDTTRNFLYIDYRSPDTPPAETGMGWGLYENESAWNSAINTGGNGILNTYQSQLSASCSRVIIQSPSALAWQLRICLPTSYDAAFQGGAVSPHGYVGGGALTMAPGYGGNSVGDFQVGGQHMDAALFFNKHDSNYSGLNVAWFPSQNGQHRNYLWGDDVTGNVFAASRIVFGGHDCFFQVGTCEEEQTPLAPHPVQRLFVMGGNATGNFGDNGIYWAGGSQGNTGRGGASFGYSGQPVSCMYSIYNSIAGMTFSDMYISNTPFRNLGSAMDTPYLQATELLPVDILAGTHDNMNVNSSGPEILVLETRRLGTAPMVRLGPTHTGYFQTTSDGNRSWIHLNDGIYLPWQGNVIQF